MASLMQRIFGKDKSPHLVATRRKCGPGVGVQANILNPMAGEKLQYIRTRAEHTTREAIQREWILRRSYMSIRHRLVGV